MSIGIGITNGASDSKIRVDASTSLLFELFVDANFVEAVGLLGKTHYDFTCKTTAVVLVQRATREMELFETYKEFGKEKSAPKIEMNSRDVDTLMKILEGRMYLNADHPQYIYTMHLEFSLRSAWYNMQKHYKYVPWASHNGMAP